MTPDEHKAEAERLVGQAKWRDGGVVTIDGDPATANIVAAAQVHATLALVREPVEPVELAEISTIEADPYSLRLLPTGSVVRAYDADQKVTPRAEMGQ